MEQETTTDLEQLGLRFAREVAGDDSVEQVEVVGTVDVDYRPAYHFSLLVDQSRFKMRPGLVFTRLSQRLKDDLRSRGDQHQIILQFLDHADWPRRLSARSV